jgi:Domain of unknown function DUF1828
MDCAEIINQHTSYLSEGFYCERLDEGKFLIVTPYQLPDGDLVELTVESRPGDRLRVRDLGETLSSLLVQGFDPNASDKRRWLLQQALVGYGVSFDGGELQKEGPQQEVGALLLDVAAAARSVADLIFLHRSQEPRDFESRVVSFLADHPVEVQPKVVVRGVSGHPYRLTARVIRGDGRALLVSTLSPRSRSQIKGAVDRTVRQWVDINGSVDRLEKLSFLNDVAVGWPPADLRLLNRFSIVTGWRVRHHLTSVLEGSTSEPDFELALPLWEDDDAKPGDDQPDE